MPPRYLLQEFTVSLTVPAVRGPRLEVFSARVMASNEQDAVKKAWTIYRIGKTRPAPPPIARPPQLDRRRRERREAWSAMYARVKCD